MIGGSEGLIGGQWRVANARMNGDEEDNQKCKFRQWQVQRDPELDDRTFDGRAMVRGTNLLASGGTYGSVDINMAGKVKPRSLAQILPVGP